MYNHRTLYIDKAIQCSKWINHWIFTYGYEWTKLKKKASYTVLNDETSIYFVSKRTVQYD